jgi:hypothetical protein
MGQWGHCQVHTPEKGLWGTPNSGLWWQAGSDAAALRSEPEDRADLHHEPAEGRGQYTRTGRLPPYLPLCSLPPSLLPTCLSAPYLPLCSLPASLLPTRLSAQYLPHCYVLAYLVPAFLYPPNQPLCSLTASLLPNSLLPNCLPLLPHVPSSPLSRQACLLPTLSASASYLPLCSPVYLPLHSGLSASYLPLFSPVYLPLHSQGLSVLYLPLLHTIHTCLSAPQCTFLSTH